METNKYDVFISYSRKDYVDEHKNVIPGNEVSKIKEALTEAGITYWFDEDGVCSGDEFAKIIVRSIKASKIFVFLSTVNSNQSVWTANEISTANMLKKKIIPVRIDDSVYNDDVIFYISRLSHIEYYDNPENGRQELIHSINAYLNEAKANEAQKIANEKRRQEEIERQRKKQEEEKKRQEKAAKIETEIAALESQKTERKKAVFLKEKELKLAQVDLEACEAKIQKLQNKLMELRELQISEQKREEEDRLAEEQKREEKTHVKEKTFKVGDVSFKMIRVEGGRFQMGSPKNDSEAYGNEKPQHWVTLGDYYIGETVVTQSLWKAVMRNEQTNKHGWENQYGSGDNYPAYRISYNDIVNDFIPRLNKLTGKYFRLPTEAEWEYAARGGNKGKGFKYAGGNNIGDVAWYWKNSGDKLLSGLWNNDRIHQNNCKTHPVKKKQPNELKLFDMSGNVWEWCQDWYGDYLGFEQSNPQGPVSGSNRVLRGGNWYYYDNYCRVAYRYSGAPSDRYSGIGFRLVLASPIE